jgi:AcrR family transcriptional regulator
MVHPRQRLLDAAIEHVAAHGLADLSLRELASALGTSHRMLIYHFGSKDRLMMAIVDQVEERQRQIMAALDADVAMTPAEAGLAYWRQVTDPSLVHNVRLFFEVYSQALQGRPGTEGFLDRVVDAWLGPITAYWQRRGVPPETARAEARLGIAVTRGLLLDLVATGDREGVDAAFRRYLRLYTAGGEPPSD